MKENRGKEEGPDRALIRFHVFSNIVTVSLKRTVRGLEKDTFCKTWMSSEILFPLAFVVPTLLFN